jgi:cytochrome bd ubiquinol oxidase subunit II
MIPYEITVGNAAAPEASLSFLFWGAGVFVLPVIAIYTTVVYWLFRGKVRSGYDAAFSSDSEMGHRSSRVE